jgi:hypothetical protein
MRPPGIALEDKFVRHAVVTVLNAISEVDFLGFSYGLRPGLSPHDALYGGPARRRVNRVHDADIRGFFAAIDHGWLPKCLEHRIADPRIPRVIRKWLRAGVSEAGTWSETTVGTPQGAAISPLPAHGYLPYVLDLCAHRRRSRSATGHAIVVGCADDFILGFHHRDGAERFPADLPGASPPFTRGRGRMREIRAYGSMRGASATDVPTATES